MAGGFWSAGDTNFLASRGMNQDQSGWDSLQSWYDEKAKREREAAETARKAALLKQMADEEEADRRKALGLQVRERATIAAQAQGEDPNETAPTWEEFRAKYGTPVQPAPGADAFDPDGSVSVVVGEDDLKRDWEARVAGVQGRTAKWQDRFKKADELIAAGFNPFVTDEGEVYSTLDNAKSGVRAKAKKQRDDIDASNAAEVTKIREGLANADRDSAIESLRQDGYDPETIKKFTTLGDIAKRRDDLVARAKEIDPVKQPELKLKVEEEFKKLTRALSVAGSKGSKARASAYTSVFRKGIDAQLAKQMVDEKLAQSEDSVLGTSYDSVPTLQRLVAQFGMMDPGADPTKNPYLSRLANQTKGEFKLDDTRLKNDSVRETNMFNTMNRARSFLAEAEKIEAQIQKEKEADDTRIKVAKINGASRERVAKMNADAEERKATKAALAAMYRAEAGKQAAAITATGVVAGYGKSADPIIKVLDTFNVGTGTAGKNITDYLSTDFASAGLEMPEYTEDPSPEEIQNLLWGSTTQIKRGAKKKAKASAKTLDGTGAGSAADAKDGKPKKGAKKLNSVGLPIIFDGVRWKLDN